MRKIHTIAIDIIFIIIYITLTSNKQLKEPHSSSFLRLFFYAPASTLWFNFELLKCDAQSKTRLFFYCQIQYIYITFRTQ